MSFTSASKIKREGRLQVASGINDPKVVVVAVSCAKHAARRLVCFGINEYVPLLPRSL